MVVQPNLRADTSSSLARRRHGDLRDRGCASGLVKVDFSRFYLDGTEVQSYFQKSWTLKRKLNEKVTFKHLQFNYYTYHCFIEIIQKKRQILKTLFCFSKMMYSH